MTQHDFSAFGVQPTCSVSMINSGPAFPLDPSEFRQEARTQYVIPGSKSIASPVTILPSPATDKVVFPAGLGVHCCSICFHSISYLSIDETGLNCTEIVVSVASINSSFGPGTDMIAGLGFVSDMLYTIL